MIMQSGSPTVVREDLAVDLPDELTTRWSPRCHGLQAGVRVRVQHARTPVCIPVEPPAPVAAATG